jgi:hypothetical protein
MHTKLKAALAVSALTLATTAMAQVTFYEGELPQPTPSMH